MVYILTVKFGNRPISVPFHYNEHIMYKIYFAEQKFIILKVCKTETAHVDVLFITNINL